VPAVLSTEGATGCSLGQSEAEPQGSIQEADQRCKRVGTPSSRQAIPNATPFSGRAFSTRSTAKTIPGPPLRFSPGFNSSRAFGTQERI